VGRDVEIRGDTIRLGQLLKLAGLAAGGGEAKSLLSDAGVWVNGEPESRRGRQLHPGDTVQVEFERIRIVAKHQVTGDIRFKGSR
jgi:ribosome-associated protein